MRLRKRSAMTGFLGTLIVIAVNARVFSASAANTGAARNAASAETDPAADQPSQSDDRTNTRGAKARGATKVGARRAKSAAASVDEAAEADATAARPDGAPDGKASSSKSAAEDASRVAVADPDELVKRATDLIAKGYRFAALAMLTEVAQTASGRSAQEEALALIENLAQTGPYDLDRMLTLASELRIKSKSPLVSAFLSYHIALLNLNEGQSNWAANEMATVVGASFWRTRWTYDLILRRYRAGDDPGLALRAIQKLAKTKDLPAQFQRELTLTQARLHFELGQYHKAEELYANLSSGLRDWGRTTLERAWANYHLKDFSRTLGLLQSLRAPYFNPSLEPERVVLEILVLNQVCDHEAIIALVNDARVRYGTFVQSVKSRKDLIQDMALVNQALLERPLREKGEQVEESLKEIASLEKSGIAKRTWAQPVVAALKAREAELRDEIDFDSRGRLDQLADSNLKFLEQIEFLDYQARLEVSNRKASNFQEPPKAPPASLDRVSWPQRYNEFWLDEFPNYQIRLKDYCGGGKS